MRDLLRRLQEALPEMERWIGRLHAQHASRAVPAREAGPALLVQYFPAAVLDGARVVTGESLPFPPVAEYGLPEFAGMAASDMAGITFGDMYFLRQEDPAGGVHLHELVHVVQWKTLGVAAFLSTYAVGLAQHAYEKSPLESVAFWIEGQLELGIAPLDVSDFVARHALAARDAAGKVFATHHLQLGA
jgi:hypothetical protein